MIRKKCGWQTTDLKLQRLKLPTMLCLAGIICLIDIACQAQMETPMLHTTIQPEIQERMFPQLIQALLILTIAITR